MKKYFDNLTEALQNFLIEVGELSYFAGRFFKEFWKPPIARISNPCPQNSKNYKMTQQILFLIVV